MKKVLLALALLLSLNGIAAEVIINDKTKVDCEAILKIGDKELIAQRGCCSHHQGVCGCSNGRDKCCDGVLSPSCTCNSIVPIEESTGTKI
ncbi:hypothetical protein [Sulfuricurvum sp.]|uniref:hypothetical protein n=1 Tax=Sulfuricurvum sp. TaxID=2025608 RepID=UPI002E33B3C3|nr:hypothetical protein [Sulfuricurvum sp.]HEX5330630.1 hypothetical protein [Sulfuricurvum sp.]